MDRENDLETLFAAASRQRLEPSAGLSARILADAAALQPKARARVPVTPPRPDWFSTVSSWLGGGAALAGVSAAALAGLYLGVVQPAPVRALTALVAGNTASFSLDLLPSSDALLTQE